MISHKKLDNFHARASVTASMSHDAETKVGSLLIDPKTLVVLCEGYNGFIRGAQDDRLPNTRPDKVPYILHSEINLLCSAARHGIKTDGCILYCTLSPCINCMRTLYQAGITTIYCKDKYRDFDINCNMKDLQIDIDYPFGYVKINLSPRSELPTLDPNRFYNNT